MRLALRPPPPGPGVAMRETVKRGARLREPFSGLSHLAGCLAAIGGLVHLVLLGRETGDPWLLGSVTIYGATLVLMFLSSSLYHLLPVGPRAQRHLRITDHQMIYLLIAGSYTPICLGPLRGWIGWSLLGTIWGMAALGMVMKVRRFSLARWLSVLPYVVMGCLVLIAVHPMVQKISPDALPWLAGTGVAYLLGAVVYTTRRPDPFPGVFGFHELWHLFVIGGSFCYYWFVSHYLTTSSPLVNGTIAA